MNGAGAVRSTKTLTLYFVEVCDARLITMAIIQGMVGGQKPIVTSTIALQFLISLKEITSVSYRTKQERVPPYI